MDKQDQIKVGKFTFEYDVKKHEIYIIYGEEASAMVECVSIEDWLEFYNDLVRTGH